MKHLVLLFIFSIFFLRNTNAQEVITTAGDHHIAISGSLSWTLGEVIIETLSTDLNSVTQGFNQSQLSATATYELPSLSFNLSAFPNPTSDFIILETDQVREMEYQVFNQQGKLIIQSKLTGFQTKIDFQDLTPAIYIIKIFENNIPLKQFKIIKH